MTGRLFAIVLLVPVLAWAGDPPVSYVVQPADREIAPPEPAKIAPKKLPYGVEDVVKLSRAGISEDIILNYVQSSGTIYTLGPQEIVALKEQGVSDRVLNAMIDQRKVVVPATSGNYAVQSPAPAQTGVHAQVAQPSPSAPVNVNVTVPAQTYAPAPPPAPVSTVHVIPYPAARAAYYGPPPYYYRPPDYGWYYRYPGPSVHVGLGVGFGYSGFRFGFGGHRHCYW